MSRQLSLKPAVLSQLRNHPSARSATFEAVRKHLDVRAWQEADAEQLSAYLIEKVSHTGNPSALFDAATDWMVRVGVLRRRERRPLTAWSIKSAIKRKIPCLSRSLPNCLTKTGPSWMQCLIRHRVIVGLPGWCPTTRGFRSRHQGGV